MAYNNKYNWSRKFTKNGFYTKWYAVLKCVNACAPDGVSRRQIIECVWGLTPDCFNWKYKDNCSGEILSGNSFRGWNAHLFACMSADELISYNPRTKRWNTGVRGMQILKSN